jgi:hypothetical protein
MTTSRAQNYFPESFAPDFRAKSTATRLYRVELNPDARRHAFDPGHAPKRIDASWLNGASKWLVDG